MTVDVWQEGYTTIGPRDYRAVRQDDRQRLLPAVCEQPVLLEQRLYQLSHAVMDDMAK